MLDDGCGQSRAWHILEPLIDFMKKNVLDSLLDVVNVKFMELIDYCNAFRQASQRSFSLILFR